MHPDVTNRNNTLFSFSETLQVNTNALSFKVKRKNVYHYFMSKKVRIMLLEERQTNSWTSLKFKAKRAKHMKRNTHRVL